MKIYKIYTEKENGVLAIDTIQFPADKSNRFYAQALAEVEAGEAEILG